MVLGVNDVGVAKKHAVGIADRYCRECCLVLSGMLLSVCPNGWDCLSQWVGLFVPTGGTICPNGWDYLSQWVGLSRSILFCTSFNITSLLIPRPFPDGSPLPSGEGLGERLFPPPFGEGWGGAVGSFLCSLCSLLCSLRNLLILNA